MTGDLVAFLRARLDEDKQTARACDGHEAFDGTGIVAGATTRGPVLAVLPSHVATHIGRHDSARVLAEVDAKRRILEQHHRSGVTCPRCSLGTEDGHVVFERDPCQTLRALALPYRDHPDYQPDWAPRES